MFKRKKVKYIYRCAIDGRIVSRFYAILNPFTTVREKVDA